ncbi:MAG: putative heme-binding domain-containing protein [Planctomycetota bacterium]|jgi:putative heme-binding domain-containing protein
MILNSILLASLLAPPYADGDSLALAAEQIELAEGFVAELLYTVPRETQGSWVSLTVGPDGTLFSSDQYGALYQVKPGVVGAGESTLVSSLGLETGQAQGLLWAMGSLYFVGGTGGSGSGLFRAEDTTGDGELDSVQLLQALAGQGEHGPHALRLTPEGDALYIIAGNHTAVPELSNSLVPLHWGEDQLLERHGDPRGHAVGVMAPGGWLCRVSLDGKEWELVSCGMRNSYDFAIDNNGELFTYDSDMEWDIGLAWYRPTRILHLVSGADFGWRHGSGKWPATYPDSWPGVLDMGAGSPTGVEFAPAGFPAKWRNRLLVADWTHGVLHGVRLEADGASYSGESAVLASGKPLQITDLCVGADDALYFITGGRRTQSALYRITAIADDESAATDLENLTLQEDHFLRLRLESMHHALGVDAVDQAWGFLAHSEPHVRRAARVALEHQPVSEWTQRALGEMNANVRLQALVALARTAGEKDLQHSMLSAFKSLPIEQFEPWQQVDALRLVALIAIRQGPLAEVERLGLLERLDGLFPSHGYDLDRELMTVLTYLEAPNLVERGLAEFDVATTQEQKVHYLFTLQELDEGWTPELRLRYFSAIKGSIEGFLGGASMQQYLTRARDQAMASLSKEDRLWITQQLEVKPQAIVKAAVPASFVRAWSMQDFADDLDQDWSVRDRKLGKELYERATCTTCHRMAGTGGSTGPDLSAASGRFSARDVLETMIDPNLEISDQYRDTEILTVDGELFVGRVEQETEELLTIRTLPPEEDRVDIYLSEIQLRQLHSLSRMPAGLLDGLTHDEVLDLLAYLLGT